jgi:hypothetical protein
LIFSLAGQAALIRPGQAAGQARLEKSGLLAALIDNKEKVAIIYTLPMWQEQNRQTIATEE